MWAWWVRFYAALDIKRGRKVGAELRRELGERMSEFPELHTLWNYNDPAETAVRFQALLPEVEASDDRAYHVELLSQIARTHSLRRQFDEAHALLNTAEAMLTAGMIVPKIRCLLERGRSFNSAGEPQRALPLFYEAFELGTAVIEFDNIQVIAP